MRRRLKPEPMVLLAGDQLMVFECELQAGPPCVAARPNGKQCGAGIVGDVYIGFIECHIPGTGGSVSIYDTGGYIPAAQMIRQRCDQHVNSDALDAVEPTGEVFEPERHAHIIRRNYPYWTPNGIVHPRSRTLGELLAIEDEPGDESTEVASVPVLPKIPVLPPEPKPTALYRYWDDQDNLLYIGITNSYRHRERSHIKGSSWSDFVARSAVERHPSRPEAEAAEIAAIQSERPLFNTKHNESPEVVQRLVEYLVAHGRTDLLTPAVSRG